MTARRIAARNRMKNWEIIADNLSKAGWSWGCVSAIDSEGRTIWIVDAQREDGRRFVVHADENESHSNDCASQMPEKLRTTAI
jgi:hypothetical protein